MALLVRFHLLSHFTQLQLELLQLQFVFLTAQLIFLLFHEMQKRLIVFVLLFDHAVPFGLLSLHTLPHFLHLAQLFLLGVGLVASTTLMVERYFHDTLTHGIV